MLLVAGVPCAAFAVLSCFQRTLRLAVWLWRIGILAFGWLSGSVIRIGIDAPAPTDDMQTRISLVMAIWIMTILIVLCTLLATAVILRLVPRTREVGRQALRALPFVSMAAIGGYFLPFRF